MSIDRQADLHYAYQFGQDAARNDYHTIRAEFLGKFPNDTEASAEFDKGYQRELARQTNPAKTDAVTVKASNRHAR